MGWPITKNNYIYAIRCIPTEKVYIGRSYRVDGRIREHFLEKRRNIDLAKEYGRYDRLSQFEKDLDIYGRESFEVYILEEDVPPGECKAREAFWIAEYRATESNFGYNKRSEETPKRVDFIRGCPPKKRGTA